MAMLGLETETTPPAFAPQPFATHNEDLSSELRLRSSLHSTEPRLRLLHGTDGTVDNAEPTAIVEPTGNGVYVPAANYRTRPGQWANEARPVKNLVMLRNFRDLRRVAAPILTSGAL
ncbi:hypothetical protein AAVH_19882 [Aphelenchoides avenae]|nr:hypothetical protein AAVH_19882 [Aphelenchus avenae]